jgi:Ca-activated chloride channel family protein
VERDEQQQGSETAPERQGVSGEQKLQPDRSEGKEPEEEEQTGKGEKTREAQQHTGEQVDEKSASLDAKEEAKEKQAPGSPRRDELGRDTGERHVRPQDEARSAGVDRVDQSGQPQPQESEEQADGSGSDKTRLSGANALMEQWLDQVEGDPAQLMQQQFRLEEYKYLRSRGGRDTETRPW